MFRKEHEIIKQIFVIYDVRKKVVLMLRDTIECTMFYAHIKVKACNTLVKEMRHFTLLTLKLITDSFI